MLQPSTVPALITVTDQCPNCEVAVIFEDRGGLLVCPNCGCPHEVPYPPTLEDWAIVLTAPPEPLDEAGWTQLLAHVDQLDTREV